MEHKLDDFFRRKTENIEDNIPENSNFDEQLFWGTLQKNLDKPQRKAWWKWVVAAACLGGVVLWIVSISRVATEIPVISHTKRVEPTPTIKPDCSLVVVHPKKLKESTHKPKKKEIIESKKELKVEVENLAIKANPIPIISPTIKQDSIHFKPLIVAETKPQFKTIHVNEISNTEQTPIPQPKFKIRFAARNQN
ncbi:hypothetical protein [Emticicia fontis]